MMKRVLVFEDSERGRDRFSMLYQGFNSGGQVRYAGQQKPMAATRTECRILDKLDAISDEAPDGTPSRLIMRSLKNREGEQQLELSEDEYGFLKAYFDHAAGAWMPVAARKVVDVADWLAGIPQVDDAVKTPTNPGGA